MGLDVQRGDLLGRANILSKRNLSKTCLDVDLLGKRLSGQRFSLEHGVTSVAGPISSIENGSLRTYKWQTAIRLVLSLV
jgi:hypothetical protein